MRFHTGHESWIAFAGTGLLSAFLYFGIVLSDEIATQQIQREIAETQVLIGNIPTLDAEREELRRQVHRQSQYVSSLEDRVPEQMHVADILHQIACLARSSGLTISRLEPLPSIDFGSYADHPFQLACQGTFDDLSKFLNGLETQVRLVTFGDVELVKEAQSPSQAVVLATIQANLQFTVYSRQSKSTRIAENTTSRGLLLSDN